MTKNWSAGVCGVVVVVRSLVVVCFGAVVLVVVLLVDVLFDVVVFFFAVLFAVVDFDDAAVAEPETATASATPSENVTTIIAAPATVPRRRVGLLTTHLPCRSPLAAGS